MNQLSVTYDEILREAIVGGESSRPRCPNCGEPNPVAHGISWCCNGCGRQWKKHPTPRIDISLERKPCPSCGEKAVILRGAGRALCKVCGKTFRKDIVGL